MEKTILLFGFDTLPEILPVAEAAKPFGAEVIPVRRGEYGRTLGALAGTARENTAPYAGGPLGGRMMVLCGLSAELDALLPAMTGVPPCLKAALTDTNRRWTAVKLYAELEREHWTMQGRNRT